MIITTLNFDDSGDDDNNNDGGDELRERYNNLSWQRVSNDNDDEELLRKYNNLKTPLNDEELLHRYNDLRTPLLRDVPPSPPPPLRRPDIKKEYDDTFLPGRQNPTTDALKTDFDRPITSLIDKANNIIEMILKNGPILSNF